MSFFRGILCAAALVAGPAWAGSPLRLPVHFAITNDAGLGYEWFVVGGHPDIGSWDPAHAVKLVWSEGNVWWGDIGVQAGTTLQYKFIKRLTAADQIGDSENADWWPEDVGANLQTNVPAEPAAPFSGKTVEFYSDMTNVDLVFSTLSAADFGATGTWNTVGMTLAGPGLRAGEWRYLAEGVGTEGEWMRFTFHGLRNGVDTWEGAWDGNDYWTPLDRLVVRDRQVFNYLPPSNGVSASHILTNYVVSTTNHVTGRWVRVYFPRGYAENVDRRYPVVYMSDGQNVFHGSPVCWEADTTADAEIKGGRMREAILVGVPSAANRQTEYLPHMDTDPDEPAGTVGRANYYADFLIHNVRPMVDFNYRTKNDRANTACIGSSSGGLLATYLGTWTNVFGLVGAMSGVYSADFCPNFRTWLESARPHDVRFWIDVGNVGGELNIGGISLYNDNFDLYWYLMGFGYVPNVDLRFLIGIGHDHNEAAWAARLPYAYRFLLDVREEPNPLLAPEMAATGSARHISFPVFAGTAYAVEKSDALTDGWTPVTNWARESKPWTHRTVNVESLGGAGFFRVTGQ